MLIESPQNTESIESDPIDPGDGTNTYTYDNTNRLASVTKTGSTVTYQYNGLGQRIEKTVGSTTTVYVYDEAGHLLGEYTSTGGLMAEHIWLNNRPIGLITSSGLYYVQTDQLGAPRVITNSSKTVVWQWHSDPFGNGAPTCSLTYNLRFPGQYYDAETGKNYNYFRDYDPTTGRYIESDPIGLNGGINNYAFVKNNPFGFVDSLGLYWQYCQNTGALNYVNDQTGLVTPIATGLYSGKGVGKNNPAYQYVENKGPLPVGEYWMVKDIVSDPNLHDPVIYLLPFNVEMGKRTGDFLIHGDSIQHPGNASEGCIIAPHNVREWLNASTDPDLKVVECN